MGFKQENFQKRVKTSTDIMKQYPNCVPVICEPAKISQIDVSTYFHVKYIVPRECTIARFMLKVRSQLNLNPEIAMYMFIGDFLPPVSQSIGEVYEKYHENDGFLYMEFAGENFFG